MATLHELITKVIPLKGILRTPSYWMRQVLMAIADAIEAVNTKSALRDSVLQSGKTSMTYFPKSNSVLLQDGNGYVQLFGTRSGDGTMIVKLLDGYDNVEILGSLVTAKNGIITYHRQISNKLLTKLFGSNGNRIKSIDFSSFCTANVTNMSAMFFYCSSLTSLDLSNFDTSAVTNMYRMFWDCSSLTSLNLSNFDTSAVTDMRDMFYGCSSLTSLNLSNFDTSAVTNMWSMFNGCTALTSLDVSNFDTSAVTSMLGMFSYCSSLTSLDLSNFNTSAVTDMYDMFNGCSALTSLDLSNFNTSAVTRVHNMFNGCSALTSLDLSNFDISKVTSKYDMFKNCTALRNIKCKQAFKDWCVANASNMGLTVANITWEIVQ